MLERIDEASGSRPSTSKGSSSSAVQVTLVLSRYIEHCKLQAAAMDQWMDGGSMVVWGARRRTMTEVGPAESNHTHQTVSGIQP
jgi:hypothetical protein